MGSSEESLLLENIQEFINDENRIVTCKWLSLTMSIHINNAKQALCNFVDEERNKGGNDDINVTYFVSGFGETKLGQQVLKCIVVPETDLETVKSTLNPVTSCHIYSVQRAKLKDYTPLYQTDYDAIKENLHNINKYSSIKCPWATSNKERASVRYNSNKDSATKAKSANEENVLSTNKSPSKDSSAKPTEKSKNKTSQIASMFAAAGKKDKKETPSPDLEKETKSKDKIKEPKGGVRSFFKAQPDKRVENQEKKQIGETKDSKTGSKSSSNKKPMDSLDDPGPQRKRRRIRTDLFDSSDEDDNGSGDEKDEHLSEQQQPEPEADEEEEMEDDPKEEKVPSPKKDKKTDTSTVVSEKKKESQSATGRKRKRIRRLVPKQHIDEDGYMVTEKVWESDSTDASDEEEKQEQPKTSPKAPAKVSPPLPSKANAGTKKKASKQSPSKNKQTSLTSFFKRK